MPDHELPEVDGLLTRIQVAQTIDAIASVQLPDGNIPWTPGHHTDPWNLVEAAMALDVGDLVYIPGHVLMVIGRIDGKP